MKRKTNKRASTVGRRTGVDIVQLNKLKLNCDGIESFGDYWQSSESSFDGSPSCMNSSPIGSDVQRFSSFFGKNVNEKSESISFINPSISSNLTGQKHAKNSKCTSDKNINIGDDASNKLQKGKMLHKGRRTGVNVIAGKEIEVSKSMEDFKGYWTDTHSELNTGIDGTNIGKVSSPGRLLRSNSSLHKKSGSLKVDGSNSKYLALTATYMPSQTLRNEGSFSSKSDTEDTLCEVNTIDDPILPDTPVKASNLSVQFSTPKLTNKTIICTQNDKSSLDTQTCSKCDESPDRNKFKVPSPNVNQNNDKVIISSKTNLTPSRKVKDKVDNGNSTVCILSSDTSSSFSPKTIRKHLKFDGSEKSVENSNRKSPRKTMSQTLESSKIKDLSHIFNVTFSSSPIKNKQRLSETQPVKQQINSSNINDGASNIVSGTSKVLNEKNSSKKHKKSKTSDTNSNEKKKSIDSAVSNVGDLEMNNLSPKCLNYGMPNVRVLKSNENFSNIVCTTPSKISNQENLEKHKNSNTKEKSISSITTNISGLDVNKLSPQSLDNKVPNAEVSKQKENFDNIVSETFCKTPMERNSAKHKKYNISEAKGIKNIKYTDSVSTNIEELVTTGVSLKYGDPIVIVLKQNENSLKSFADKTASKSKSSKSKTRIQKKDLGFQTEVTKSCDTKPETANTNPKSKGSKSKARKRKSSSSSIISLSKDKTESETPGFKRSKRERIPPLESWRLERRVFGYKNGEVVNLGYVEGLPADKSSEKYLRKQKEKTAAEPKKEKAKKSGKKAIKLDDNSTNVELVQSNINKISVSNPYTGREEYVYLHRPFDTHLWSAPPSLDQKNPPYTVAKSVSGELISFGYIEIGIAKKKEEQFSPTDNITFTVIKGKVKIRVNKQVLCLNELDKMTVPSANAYSIKNTGKIPALISFCTYKVPLFDYQFSANYEEAD